MKKLIILSSIFLISWQLLVTIFNLPSFILPGPIAVLQAFRYDALVLWQESLVTGIEAIVSYLFAVLFGVCSALILSYYTPVRRWFLPVLILSQALPIFAVAPMFVLWFGYGMTAKILIGILMLFFPVTNAFYDGLARTPKSYLYLAQTMGASSWRQLWFIRVPAALPQLASGMRIAATYAPMAAIIGEWVGSSRGLGFLMLNANARMQTDLMFAAILTLVVFTLCFYFLIDKSLAYFIYWSTND